MKHIRTGLAMLWTAALALSICPPAGAVYRETDGSYAFNAVRKLVTEWDKLAPDAREALKAGLNGAELDAQSAADVTRYLDVMVTKRRWQPAVIEVISTAPFRHLGPNLARWLEVIMNHGSNEALVGALKHLLGQPHVIDLPGYPGWIERVFSRYAFQTSKMRLMLAPPEPGDDIQAARRAGEALIEHVLAPPRLRALRPLEWLSWTNRFAVEIGTDWTVAPEYAFAEHIIPRPDLFEHEHWQGWVDRFLTDPFSANWLVKYALSNPELIRLKPAAWADAMTKAVRLGAEAKGDAAADALGLDRSIVRSVLARQEAHDANPSKWAEWMSAMETRPHVRTELAWVVTGVDEYRKAIGVDAVTVMEWYLASARQGRGGVKEALSFLSQDSLIEHFPQDRLRWIGDIRKAHKVRFWNLPSTRRYKRGVLVELDRVEALSCQSLLVN